MQNDRIITGSEDRTIKIWDLNAEANVQTGSINVRIVFFSFFFVFCFSLFILFKCVEYL